MVEVVTRIFASEDEIEAIPRSPRILSRGRSNVDDLKDTARTVAQQNVDTRNSVGRTSSVRRINNDVRSYQYNSQQGEYVAAESAGGFTTAQGIGNTLSVSNQNVMLCGQTRTVVWKIRKA